MDLKRLKIEEGGHPSQNSKSSRTYYIVMSVVFAAGVLLGTFLPGISFSRKAVKTMVLKQSGSSQSARFTAGGWIEARTPQYPLLISCRVSERIEAILVTEGQTVKPGQELVKAYDKDLKVKLELARARRNAVAKNLELLKSGYREEDVRNAEARFNEAGEKLRIAKANYERVEKLHAKNAASDKELDNTLTAFKQAESFCRAASTEYDKFKKGYREEEIAIAQAQSDEAESELELARRNLDYCVMKVPEDVPELRVLKIFRRQGEMINPDKENTTILSLYDPRDMQVRVDVPQSNVKYVKAGARALIRTDAIPNKEYSGTVLRAEPMAELAKNTITARVKIDNPDEMLFPDMVAKITFLDSPGTDSKQGGDGMRIPLSAVVRDSSGEHVFLAMDGRARKQSVRISAAGQDSESVLVEGLSSGQRLIVTDPSSLKDGQKIKEL